MNQKNRDVETRLEQPDEAEARAQRVAPVKQEKPKAPGTQASPGGSKVALAGAMGAVGGAALASSIAVLKTPADAEPGDLQDEPPTGGGGGVSFQNFDPATAPVATCVNNDMDFNEAFAAARAELGPGGVFWHEGKLYHTYTFEEVRNLADSIPNWEPEPIDDPSGGGHSVVVTEPSQDDPQYLDGNVSHEPGEGNDSYPPGEGNDSYLPGEGNDSVQIDVVEGQDYSLQESGVEAGDVSGYEQTHDNQTEPDYVNDAQTVEF